MPITRPSRTFAIVTVCLALLAVTFLLWGQQSTGGGQYTGSAGGVLSGSYPNPGFASTTGTGSVVLSISPTLTGTPIAPTATLNTNTTQIATTAYTFGMVPQRTSCGTGTTCTVTTLTSPLKDAYGTVQLSGGTATVTGIPAFASTTTAQCFGN